MTRYLLCVVLWTIIFAACTSGPAATARAEENVDLRVRQLVEKLASPNPQPTADSKGPFSPPPPKGYDFAAQEKVLATAQEIAKIGPAAIPELLKHVDDERYSASYDTRVSGNRALSVGNVCGQLIGLQINGGFFDLWPWRGSPLGHIKTNRELLTKHGARPFWELQVERLEHFERSVRDAAEVTTGDAIPTSSERKKELLATADQRIADLRRTKEPLKLEYPKGMMITDEHHW